MKLQSEVEEANSMIAEFMGCLIYREEGKVKRTAVDWDFPGRCGEYCYIADLQYNTSWDWLIPVVQKIVPPHGFSLDDIAYQTAVFNAMYLLNIDVVFNTVIEFIKHLKENDKK